MEEELLFARAYHTIRSGPGSIEHLVRQPLHLGLCDPDSTLPRQIHLTVVPVLQIPFHVYFHGPTYFTTHK